MSPIEIRKARAMAANAAALEYRGIPFTQTEVREVSDGTGTNKLRLTGYASVTEAPYVLTDHAGTYEETIARGAFGATLAGNPDVNLLVNHDGISLARTKAGSLQLSEDTTGLHVEARMDPARPDVQILRSAIEHGDLDEWSFAFRVSPGGNKWNDDYTKRRITAVDLNHGDVSVVNFGASSHTAGLIDLRRRGFVDERAVRSRLLSAGIRPPRRQPGGGGAPLALYQARELLSRTRNRPMTAAEREQLKLLVKKASC